MSEKKGSGGGIIAAVGIVVALPVAAIMGIIMIFSSTTSETGPSTSCGLPGGQALTVQNTGSFPAVGKWNTEQVSNAAMIAKIGADRQLGVNAQLIAIMAAMQESSLINKHFGDRDSLGFFQMRPSMGWGTPEQVTDPDYAINKFYNVLEDVPGWQSKALGEVAQAVELSGYPELYARHETDARRILSTVTGTNATVEVDGAGAVMASCSGAVSLTAVQGVKELDALPRFPIPAGCTDAPTYDPGYGLASKNGALDVTTLCKVPGSQILLQPRAAAALVALREECAAKTGITATFNFGYRDRATQQRMIWSSRPGNAAPIGYSNHGSALGVDANVGTFGSPLNRCLRQEGPRFGWWQPLWARPGGELPDEAWHFEYGTWLIEKRFASVIANPGLLTY